MNYLLNLLPMSFNVIILRLSINLRYFKGKPEIVGDYNNISLMNYYYNTVIEIIIIFNVIIIIFNVIIIKHKTPFFDEFTGVLLYYFVVCFLFFLLFFINVLNLKLQDYINYYD